MKGWSTTDSATLYGVNTWGEEFVSIRENGELCISPNGHCASLNSIVNELAQQGVGLPVLLRFPDVIHSRINALAGAFHRAIEIENYQGHFRGVFPIKVNQECSVVRDVVDSAAPHHMGLEAGSKPELLIVLAELLDPEAIIICNGYKDEEYIETALMAQRLGRRPFLVVEKPSEVELIVNTAQRLNLRPHIGVRARLSSSGTGRWHRSSGDRAKFGLDVTQIVSMIDELEAANMLDCLQLLHFHIGSQISAIRTFKTAVQEAARVYVELVRLGAPMGFLDVGGGLGVDYDGTRTDQTQSVNYTIEEYAEDVVATIAKVTDEAGAQHPHIVTEAGRAMVAHHAVLITEVIDVQRIGSTGDPDMVASDDPETLIELAEILGWLDDDHVQAAWNDSVALRSSLITQFNLGLIDLRQRAVGEELFWRIASEIHALVSEMSTKPQELSHLSEVLADTYTTNFSIFQSIPDTWAIDQLFPVMPITRLHEQPDRLGTLADLTCDSDGKIDHFIGDKKTLNLHSLDGQPYCLGFFLVGAYQEILGDLHNLFGDTHAVHVRLGGPKEYTIEHIELGDTVSEVLNYVHFNTTTLVDGVARAADKAINEGRMTQADKDTLIRGYSDGLKGYTYFDQK
jgi:arginine decarboxylase